MIRITSIVFAIAALSCLSPAADEKPAGHEFACADYSAGKVFFVGRDGQITWEYKAPSCNELWVLPNGNILFTTGHGVLEVSRDKQVVFKYESKSEIYACQRLPNGNTFVGECTTGRLLEIEPAGKIVKDIQLLPEGKDGGHAFMRNARVLANGGYLVAHYGLGFVREYDPQGKQVAEFKAPGGPHSVIRLPNGNTLIAVGDGKRDAKVFEVDKAGAVVWEISNKDLSGEPLKFMTGLHRLANGNTVFTNWLGHGNLGKAPHIFEVTPDKKVVWTYENHKDMKTISTVQILDTPADCVRGEVLH